VAHDHGGPAAQPLLFGHEPPAQHGAQAENPRHVARDNGHACAEGDAQACHGRSRLRVLGKRDEASGLVAEVREIRIGELGAPTLRVHLPDLNEAFGVGVGQRREQHGVHDGENRRARADAESEG
jgi:hypothetical protein